jgi:hypothetical protein
VTASKIILVIALTLGAAGVGSTLAITGDPAAGPTPASAFDAANDSDRRVANPTANPTPPLTHATAADEDPAASPAEVPADDTPPVEPYQSMSFDFTPLAPQNNGSVGHNAADSFVAVPSCSHQCITKGVARVQGNDVEIVVETNVPAQIWISVVATIDGEEEHWADWTATFGHTSHTWLLEDLVPGVTYYVMAAATDDNQYTSHAWGEFTLP